MNFLLPQIAYAATFEQLIAKVVQNIINPIVGILFCARIPFLYMGWRKVYPAGG